MRKIITLFFLAILLMSCDCCTGLISTVTPTGPVVNPTSRFLFIFNGESNAGGIVYDTVSLPSELLPQPQVQILNNTTFSIEDLDIGYNNNLGHYGMWADRHGWELNLANKVAAEPSYYGDTVYLVKTAQGSSTLGQWQGTPPYITNSYAWIFKKRLDTMQSQLQGRTLKKVIFVSLGINDRANATSQANFRTLMIQHIANMRLATGGGNTPVIMTKFAHGLETYNASMDTIANFSGLDSVYTIEDDLAATHMDAGHWDENGMKVICDRMLAKVKLIYP